MFHSKVSHLTILSYDDFNLVTLNDKLKSFSRFIVIHCCASSMNFSFGKLVLSDL